jgi:uncharacterized membrane protein YhhN
MLRQSDGSWGVFFALWVLWEVGVSSLVWRFYLFFYALGALGGWLTLHRCEEKLTVGFLSLFFCALGGWLRILHRCEKKLSVGLLSLFLRF